MVHACPRMDEHSPTRTGPHDPADALAAGEPRPGAGSDVVAPDAAPAAIAAPGRAERASGRPWGRVLLGAGIVLVAFNLRPVFTSLAAVLPEVRAAGLSPAGASWLTILPVLCLGVFAPLAPGLARRFGPERVLLGVLLLVALGSGLRGLAQAPALFAGAALAGVGIAVGNVLLPGLVKRDFSDRAALMTGLYTMALCAGAAGGAGLTPPVEHALSESWAGALAAWAVPALVAALAWAPLAVRAAPRAGQGAGAARGLWRDRLAWQVSLFMGLQSAFTYCVFGWLAPILRERGMDAVSAGVVVSVSILFQVAACLLVPPVAAWCRDQRAVCVVLAVDATVALLGLLFAPLSLVWLWAPLLGIGQGGLFAAAMMLMVLRSPDARAAAGLSGMAQGVGYVLASGGPLLVGLLHAWTGGFDAAAGLFVALGVGIALSGLGAGRAGQIRVRG